MIPETNEELIRHLEETLNASRLYLDRGPNKEVADLLVNALADGVGGLCGSSGPEREPLRGYLESSRAPDPLLDEAVTLSLCYREDRDVIGGVGRSDVLCLMAGLGRMLMLLERETAA